MRKIAFIAALLAGLAAHADDIAKLDKNFRAETLKNGEKVVYRNALLAPFELTGFPWRTGANDSLFRMPRSIAKQKVGRGVITLSHCSSGGAIRFATDSPLIVIRGFIKNGHDMAHMPRVGAAGLDLVQDCGTPRERLHKPLFPTRAAVDGKEPFLMVTKLPGARKMRQFTVFLPLYSGIKSIEIGVAPDAAVAAPRPQKIKDPICFYGSSVTQGGCASRPANNYTTMLCRAVDAPQVNLGFSGNAKGEAAVARAIAGLKMSAFVMDYDYNAPSAAHLKKTHAAFFRIIREAQPELPIIIISGPRDRYPDAEKRRDIVRATYEQAVAAGDRNVYFIDGLTFFDEVPRRFCTVDGSHPTDLGFYIMYQKILPVLKQALRQ